MRTAKISYVLLSASIFTIFSLPLHTNALSTIEPGASQPPLNTTNEIVPGHLVRMESERDQINQTFKSSASQNETKNRTCGTKRTCKDSSFCIGNLDLQGNIVKMCPTELDVQKYFHTGCGTLRAMEGIEVEIRLWCCRPKDLEEGCTKIYRTCTASSCQSRYCLAVRSHGAKAMCPSEIIGNIHDSECDDLAEHTTKWLGDGIWCCKHSHFCKIDTRKCGDNSTCRAPFCYKSYTSKSTICPKPALHSKTGCQKLSRGQTKNLGNGTWCCNSITCDTDVRSCGGRPCTEKFCIGLRDPDGAISTTKCPSTEPIEECINLSPDKEIALDWNTVCCNADNCIGKYRRCGLDSVCGASFCITRRLEGSIKHETTCPTPEEIKTNAEKCESLLDGKEFRIDLETFCCKASDCPMNDTLSAPGSSEKTRADSSHIVYPTIIALLIVACVGVAVLFYFIGKRKDKGTQTKTITAWKGSSKKTTGKTLTQLTPISDEKTTPVATVDPRLINSPLETENYMNLSEVSKPKRPIEQPKSDLNKTGSNVTQTESHKPIKLSL